MPDAATKWDAIVRQTQAYYDGAADAIYRDIWGENIHIGMFEGQDDTLADAMARSNERISRDVGLKPEHELLDVGCGYGALGRYLARTYGCLVLATNISEVELDWGRSLTERDGLSHLVSFEYADFHSLSYADNRFDGYWSQEAFLHAVDKNRVLGEAYRVLKPGGRLVFTDLLVRQGTPEANRQRIYDRVKSPDMWDAPDYQAALERIGFRIAVHEDFSVHVAPTYDWVRRELERRRPEFESRIGREVVDRTSAALKFWVDAAKADKIGWSYFVADKQPA